MPQSRRTRRQFLQAAGVGTAALAAGRALRAPAAPAAAPASAPAPAAAPASAPAAGDKKPNILWLIAEDICPDMACYGGQLVKTPNIDRLAGQGARFTHAFCACPVCSPSRSGFMTAMYQMAIGAHQHRTAPKLPLPPPIQLITEYFRQAGYFVSNGAGLNTDRAGKTDWNFLPQGKAFYGTDWAQRQPGQPFFAQYNFSYTHRNFSRDGQDPIDPDKVKVPPIYPDHPIARRDWADYLESMQLLDRQIGQVLARLDKEGLANDTIVFFFGDNGQPHVWGKQWLYEGGIHVPLIIRWPGRVQPAQVIDNLVSSIDLGPTAMDLAGMALPAHCQGRPFLGPHAARRDFIIAARDRCDETADRIRCIRTARHKYIRNFHPDRPYTQFNAYKKRQYPVLTLLEVLHTQGKLTADQARFMAPARPPEELYDLQSDPHELHNLASDSAAADVLKDLRGKLDGWIKETSDKGATPEPKLQSPADIAASLAAGRQKHREYLKQLGLGDAATDEDYLRWWEQKLLSPVATTLRVVLPATRPAKAGKKRKT